MISDLTNREKQVLSLYIDCGSYAAVAEEMGLAQQSVKNLAHGILRKLDSRNITQACIRYDRATR